MPSSMLFASSPLHSVHSYLLNKLNKFVSPMSQTGSEVRRLVQDIRKRFDFFGDDSFTQQLQHPEYIQASTATIFRG